MAAPLIPGHRIPGTLGEGAMGAVREASRPSNPILPASAAGSSSGAPHRRRGLCGFRQAVSARAA